MAEKETTRLCTLILREHFGDIPGRVGAELLKKGRIPLRRIARATLIKTQRVANALLVLIQHNLVWHWESTAGQELFEINADEVLTRLRYGRYLALTEELFGESAAEIISFLLDHGRLRAANVVSGLAPDENDHKRRAHFTASLASLMKEGYIKATDITLQTSPQDRLLAYEAEATITARKAPNAKKGPLAAKDILEVKEIARKRLESETQDIESSGFKKTIKDTTLTSKSSKRQKVDEGELIDEDVYLRVNPEMFNIHIRNEIFTASAAQRYNVHASAVLSGALIASLPTERKAFSVRSEPVSFHTISRSLAKPAAELGGIALPKAVSNNIDRHDDAAMRNLYVKEYVNVLCAADNPSIAGRAGAFMTLTMSGGASSKRAAVEYELIAKRLRALVFDNLVRDKWGTAGLRIVNVLRDCGKLDGEQIAKKAMLKKVDVQKYLKDMSMEGLVSSFELSRTADRTPSRSIYLWFIDTPRTYASLLHSLYRTLGNIIVRQRAELERVQPLLDKRERTDVQANVDQYMTREERSALEDYFKKREQLSVLANRIDESVFVLRDLAKNGFGGDDPYVPVDPSIKL